MSKFGLRVLTISCICFLAGSVVGCGSSESKSEPVNVSVAAQSAAVISVQTAVSIESSREIAITGELSITDAQTNEAVFKAQNNNATAYGSFSLTEDGNWSYTVNVDYATVSALSEGENLLDEVIVTSADGTTATVSITIIGTSGPDDFIVSEETMLNADGANTGLSAYTLIENAFSEGSIESPDIYSGNHQGVEHIIEDTDSIIGNHFVFLAHRDDDQDKDKGATDRQRNEIKAYDKSPAATLAFKGETVQYTWKFKVSSELELS